MVEEKISAFDNVDTVVMEPLEIRAETDEGSANKESVPGAVNRLIEFQLLAPTHARNQTDDC